MIYKPTSALATVVSVLVISGCIGPMPITSIVPVPTGGESYGLDPATIKEGVTTRSEIVAAHGRGAQTPDGRFLLYEYGGSMSTWSSTTESYADRILLEFDNNDRVKHVHDAVCGANSDARCDPNRQESLLAMVEKYYGTSVAGQYRAPLPERLCEAVRLGRLDLIEKVLAEGADINGQCRLSVPRWVADRWAGTLGSPLHLAILEPYRTQVAEKTVELLVTRGANVNSKDPTGRTPLHAAVVVYNIKLVSQLIAYRARVNAKDQAGRTPLHLAAITGQVAIAERLLAAGAMLDVADNDGDTPIDLATDPRIIELLRQPNL